jgi:hypothetical protein
MMNDSTGSMELIHDKSWLLPGPKEELTSPDIVFVLDAIHSPPGSLSLTFIPETRIIQWTVTNSSTDLLLEWS